MKPRAGIAFLVLLAAVGSGAAGDIFPFEPVDLSAEEAGALRSAVSPHGSGAAVRSIRAGALIGDLVTARVEFAEYETRSDHSLRVGVFCGYEKPAWACKAPYRIVALLDEVPLVEIELRGDVSVGDARRILAFVRARDGSHLVALTAIERKSPDEYRVDVDFTDGGGTSSVSRRGLARIGN